MPSEKFELTEEQSKLDAINRANQEITEKTKIFWAKAKRFVIGNFIPERRDNSGRIVQREVSIHFYEHIKTTDNDDIIKFIRKSDAFKSGMVIEVATLAEAQALTAKQDAIKSTTMSLTESDEETTNISLQS